jgi:hypothetical protein
MEFWSDDLNERVRFEDLGVNGQIKIKRMLKKQSGMASTGFLGIRTEASGGPW